MKKRPVLCAAAAAVLLAVLGMAPLLLCPAPQPQMPQRQTALPGPAPTAAPAMPAATPEQAVPAAPQPYRAVWVSYLEWQQVDFGSAAAFTADVRAMLQNIAAVGANVVLAQVRPFCDALYPSKLYPFSHLCTGVQGQDPGFDPLALLLQEAHALGLQVEAWLNPYRVQGGGQPAQLAAQNPAMLHPEWCKTTQDGRYLNPADPAVQAYIAAGVAELCQNYAVDGIHLDDYFYPTTDPDFDAEAFAAAAPGTDLAAWRRKNVNALVRQCCEIAHRYGVRFGIAPQGDPDRNTDTQYSDVALWLRTPGYVDYLAPQLYWGVHYGDGVHDLATLAARWAALPRAPGVALYAGLGAYRIGVGDGSGSEEWQTGNALARQLEVLHSLGYGGAALYRYGSLWQNTQTPALAAQEVAALAAAFGAG